MSTQPAAKVRRHTPRVSNGLAAWIAIVVIGLLCFFVFGGSLPFRGSGFVLRAVFTSPTDLHIPSPVRIAGVQVGEVTGVERIGGHGGAAGIVTMQIDPNGLPIHTDATAGIRSRIFLEGNFYVDLHPGSPSAPVIHSGGTLPAANTAGPVQLDRILSSLDTGARRHLQTLLQGLGASLNGAPTAAQDATQDPSVRGLTGAQALNDNLRYSAGAFEASAIVNQALLGSQPGDLAGVVKGNEEVFRGLSESPAQLEGFVTSFNRTLQALAARQQALGRTIDVLAPLLRSTDAADAALDASFPPTRAFARAIVPSLHQLDPTIGAAFPWIAQLRALVSPGELGGLLAQLTPAVRSTASSLGSTRSLVSGLDALAQCFSHTLIPTGNETISDPPSTTSEQVYQELFQSAVGLASATQNFDGNGRYVRASAGGGLIQVQTKSLPGVGPLYGNAVLAPLGTRPLFPLRAPPLDRTVACSRSAPPNLSAVATGVGP